MASLTASAAAGTAASPVVGPGSLATTCGVLLGGDVVLMIGFINVLFMLSLRAIAIAIFGVGSLSLS